MEKVKKYINRKNLIYAACGVIIIVSVALIAWVIIARINNSKIGEETTFASNDTQTTISLDAGTKEDGSEKHTRVVYQYDGDNVVGQKTYFEYDSPEAAQAAFETLKDQPEFQGGEVIDNYIVVTADPNQFKGLTADDIRQQAEAIEQFQKTQRKTTEESQPAPAEAPAESSESSESPEPTEPTE